MNLEGLRIRIEQELEKTKRLVERTQRFKRRYNLAQDSEEQEAYVDALALNLHDFYTGVERIFLRIAQDLDGSVPQGAEWHRELLRQMKEDLPGIRSAALKSESLVRDLNDLRGFRHVARNIYTYELDPNRVLELANYLPHCYQALKQEMQNFCQSFEQKSYPS